MFAQRRHLLPTTINVNVLSLHVGVRCFLNVQVVHIYMDVCICAWLVTLSHKCMSLLVYICAVQNAFPTPVNVYITKGVLPKVMILKNGVCSSSVLLYIHRDGIKDWGTGSPGYPHQDFHTAPELCVEFWNQSDSGIRKEFETSLIVISERSLKPVW